VRPPDTAGRTHGPVSADTNKAFAIAQRRAQRLVDDPAGAVWYGARRVFASAPPIPTGRRPHDVDGRLTDHRRRQSVSQPMSEKHGP
jgi:hypothetical protein